MDKLLYRPEEAARLLGVGRTRVFELIRTGELESIRVRSSRRIAALSLVRYVESLLAAAAGDTAGS